MYDVYINVLVNDLFVTFSYTISVGVVDKLSRYFTNIRGSIDGEPQVADLLQNALSLLTAMVKMLSKR